MALPLNSGVRRATMTKIYAFGKRGEDFEHLVNSFSKKEFDSPRRSTIPLLDYWRAFDGRLQDFSEVIGDRRYAKAEFHFEHRVAVQAGRGKASHTDLMIVGSGVACAIEAKFTEPPYEDVKTWLGNPPKPNKEHVLGGWLSLIQSGTGRSLHLEEVFDIPYQLIHRTASVFSVSASSRHVLYQIFDPSKEDYYLQQLRMLHDLVYECTDITFAVLVCSFEPGESYCELTSAWDGGAREMSDKVTEALTHGPLNRYQTKRYVVVA